MRLYIETSVPNFLFHDDVPEERQHTETLFGQIAEGVHEAWISGLYSEELEETQDPERRSQLKAVIARYQLRLLPLHPQVGELAQEYIAAQAFTPANRIDAQHVATAVVGGCELVVSWNFRHIVREWTSERVKAVNLRLGLPSVVICTPREVNLYGSR